MQGLMGAGAGAGLFIATLMPVQPPPPPVHTVAAETKSAAVVVPPDVDAILQEVTGFKGIEETTLDKSDKEYPFIKVKAKDGSTFFLDFEECDDQLKNCYDLWLSASWDTNEAATLDMINEWNRSSYSYAYLNKSGKPVLSQYVTLSGGLVEENLSSIVSNFTDEIDSFSKRLSGSGTKQQN
jgi:putative sensory transduction regulator